MKGYQKLHLITKQIEKETRKTTKKLNIRYWKRGQRFGGGMDTGPEEMESTLGYFSDDGI